MLLEYLIKRIQSLYYAKCKQNYPGSSNLGQDHSARSPWTGCSTQMIIQFGDGKSPKPTDKIVSLC